MKLKIKKFLFLLILPINVNAATIGIGEHRYGPDTPENFACKLAEENAKQHAIARFLGENIDSVTFESCKNNDCVFQKDTINETRGVIKEILDRRIQRIENTGYQSCIVTIKADIVKVTNTIRFSIFDDNLNYLENQIVNFTGISNRSGQIVMFNFYDGNYYKVYQQKILNQNEKFSLPSEEFKLVAKLPSGKSESKELVMFLFLENDIKVKESYTQKDLREFLSSVPFDQYRVVNRHVLIMRKL